MTSDLEAALTMACHSADPLLQRLHTRYMSEQTGSRQIMELIGDAILEIVRGRVQNGAVPGRFCPRGSLLLPENKAEAEFMYLVSEQYLKRQP